MLFERCLDVLFEALVSSSQNRIHLDVDHLLFIGRKRIRNVFERYKSAELHKKPAEEQGRSAGAPPYSRSYLRFVRAGVVGWRNGRDLFEDTIGLRKARRRRAQIPLRPSSLG